MQRNPTLRAVFSAVLIPLLLQLAALPVLAQAESLAADYRRALAAGPSDVPPVPSAAEAAAQDDFVRRAEQLFHAGRLAPGQHGAIVYTPLPPVVEGVPPSESEMRERMSRSPLSNPERERVVKELFALAGAKDGEIVSQDAGRDRHNFIAVKPGRTPRTVVVGAHHDKVSRGAGTIDNWTGTTLLINLYQAMRDVDTEATFVFVAFAREEEGLLGSKFYLNSLSREDRGRLDAMVNLDTLAVDGTFSWKNNSTASLLQLVKDVAARERLDLTETTLNGGDADSSTFRRAGIPAMTVFGASEDRIWDIIHSPNDTMASFDMGHYRNAYSLVLALIKALDTAVQRKNAALALSAAAVGAAQSAQP